MTSIASSRKIDYSHIPSKVRQYIRDMKEKDVRNSSRSLPSTPARKSMKQATSQTIVLDEKLLREIAQYKENDMPKDIRKIRDQIIGEAGDQNMLEEILKLLVHERKSRHASDTTLAMLQLRYDNLNAMFAEKQNEIDRLRFYKDICINKEYSLLFKEERRGFSGSSLNTSPLNTPCRSTPHFLSSPNLFGRRSSYHTTPPNTPKDRSVSPAGHSFNHIRSTSTPIHDRNTSLAYDVSESCAFNESIQGDANRNQVTQSDQEQVRDLETTGSSEDGVSVQSWMTNANAFLKRVS